MSVVLRVFAHRVGPAMTREGTDPRPPGLLLRIRMRSCRFCLLATILAATGSQAGDRQSLPEGFSLADPIWLEGEISSTLCQRLHFRGRPLGLIAFEMPAGDGVVFEECRQYGEGLGGSVGWFVSMPRATEFVPLDLEGLGHFSNPATCGPRIAYWGSEEIPNDKPYKLYSAYVADVPSRRLLCRQVAGRAWVGTDNPGHLRPARWNQDCSEVLMVEDCYFQPIRLSLPPVETQRLRSPILETSTPSGGMAEILERRFRTRRLIMELLIDAGADVNAQGGSPYYAGDGVTGTPLHVAVTRNRPALAESLVEHGADVDALDSAGYTSLERAAGNREMMTLLLSHGAEHDDGR